MQTWKIAPAIKRNLLGSSQQHRNISEGCTSCQHRDLKYTALACRSWTPAQSETCGESRCAGGHVLIKQLVEREGIGVEDITVRFRAAGPVLDDMDITGTTNLSTEVNNLINCRATQATLTGFQSELRSIPSNSIGDNSA